jgi:hypothetical protein
MKLYHATFRQNLPSILEKGLGAIKNRNFDHSREYTYFAEDQDRSERVIIGAINQGIYYDKVDINDVILLSVEKELLHPKLLSRDSLSNSDWIYSGTVAPDDLVLELFKGHRGLENHDYFKYGKRLVLHG